MNASMVRSVLALIPERVARAPSGAQFTPEGSACRFPERVAHLAKFLHWMSPLEALAREDQQVLGLLNAAGRPVHAVDLEDDEGELEPEGPLEGAATEPAVETAMA